MTGPEHYREAEGLISMVADPNDPRAPIKDRDALIALAQVHATLALVAATAAPAAAAGLMTPSDCDAWHQAATEDAKAPAT